MTADMKDGMNTGMSVGMPAEAVRQQQMLAALQGAGVGEPWAAGIHFLPQDWPRALRLGAPGRGLAAYRANARAHAARALAAGCPTVAALVGDDAMPALAAAYLQAHPPERGDLAELGAQLPTFIARSAQLRSEPYLADVARLDAAVAHAHTAADAVPELASLHLLGAHPSDAVWLRCPPGTQLLCSPHPIASIWWAHQPLPAGPDGDGSARDTDRFAAVRAAFAHGHGEHALVWRQGWRVTVRAQPPATARFVAALLAGVALGPALDAAGDGFDLAAWLADALGAGLLLGAASQPLRLGEPA
jgi:hypothetical protein